MKLNEKQIKKLDSLNVSNKIRCIRFNYPNISEYQISKMLNKRPQHVNNVLKTPILNPKQNYKIKL